MLFVLNWLKTGSNGDAAPVSSVLLMFDTLSHRYLPICLLVLLLPHLRQAEPTVCLCDLGNRTDHGSPVGPQTHWNHTFTGERSVVLTYRLHPLLKLLLELLLLLPQALQRLLQLISLLADEQHSTPELLRLRMVGLSRHQTVSLCLQAPELLGQGLQLRVDQKSNPTFPLSCVNDERET